MELNDALYIPLAPSVVWDALQDLALVRAASTIASRFRGSRAASTRSR